MSVKLSRIFCIKPLVSLSTSYSTLTPRHHLGRYQNHSLSLLGIVVLLKSQKVTW
jgi:hypothetical protein